MHVLPVADQGWRPVGKERREFDVILTQAYTTTVDKVHIQFVHTMTLKDPCCVLQSRSEALSNAIKCCCGDVNAT